MFILRFDLESAYALGGLRRAQSSRERTKESWRLWIDEAAAAVARICGVLERHEVPATFFVLGALLEKAGDRIASVLRDTPLVEVQSHSYSHMAVKSLVLRSEGPLLRRVAEETAVADRLRRELCMTSDLIAEHFGTRPIGFCAPGNFHRGLQGCKESLQVLRDEGYRFIGSDGEGPPEQPMPAPFTQPYWYAEDGFPDLLEEPITGWHCNMLFNTGGQSDGWKPAPGLPDGTVLDALPVTVDEGLRVRESEFRYAMDNRLVYAPGNHPWSLYGFDPEMTHLSALIEMAKANGVPVLNCTQLYEEHRDRGDSR